MKIFNVLMGLLCLMTAPVSGLAQEKIPSKGLAAVSNKGKFEVYEFERHAIGDNDILIETMYASICHSDLHHVHEDWGSEEYPMVPGHEIAGRVTQVGKNVIKFKVGDYAGVGCMINSCGDCNYCKANLEQYCKNVVMTYHAHDQYHGDEITQGGYSNNIVVKDQFAVKIPENAKMDQIAPLLCAGITTYSPLMQSEVKQGDKVAVAGYGGLGHMAVQYALKLGAEVTVFDITEDKRQDALDMGATKYVNVNNEDELKGMDDSFDFILSTIPAMYEPAMYLKMTKYKGDFAIVGLPALDNQPTLTVANFVFLGGRNVYGSQIGGMKETQEMIDFSVENNIYPMVEIIEATPNLVEEAYQNVLDGNVKFRYVIDMKTLK
ncbi:MAG: hydroxyacid dehydrogenase [Crocinitomicaceae bacterium]|nr:hydroxyacid dehydrogenase [Crocinitomicaceae bacterium]|tara:strand:+ start:797 stop:1930 length:1134 start_codon:yes stop_codon:yes gene_type:complete